MSCGSKGVLTRFCQIKWPFFLPKRAWSEAPILVDSSLVNNNPRPLRCLDRNAQYPGPVFWWTVFLEHLK